MAYKLIAWGYLSLGLTLMYILLSGNSKKVAIEVVPTAQEDEHRKQYPHVVKQAAGQ